MSPVLFSLVYERLKVKQADCCSILLEKVKLGRREGKEKRQKLLCLFVRLLFFLGRRILYYVSLFCKLSCCFLGGFLFCWYCIAVIRVEYPTVMRGKKFSILNKWAISFFFVFASHFVLKNTYVTLCTSQRNQCLVQKKWILFCYCGFFCPFFLGFLLVLLLSLFNFIFFKATTTAIK